MAVEQQQLFSKQDGDVGSRLTEYRKRKWRY